MKTCRTDDRSAYLAATLAQRNPTNMPFAIMRDVATLRRNAKALQRLAEHDCNYGLSPRQETRRDSLAAQVKAIAWIYRLEAECSGDPRGAVVKLADPATPNADDGFGGGWPAY